MDTIEVERLQRTKHEWPAIRLKYVVRLIGGGTPSKSKEEFWSNGTVPWISPKDMKRRVITDTEDMITEDAVLNSATTYVDAGVPVIVVRSGILKHSLPVALTGTRVTLNQDMKALVTIPDLDSEFLAYWIEGQASELLLEWRQLGATVESVDTYRMMNCWIKMPSIDEQKSIVRGLDAALIDLDQAIDLLGGVMTARSALHGTLPSIILEKRAAVINAAVTGKSMLVNGSAT